MPFQSIQTPRLNLRPFTMEDVDPFYRVLTEPDILRYFPNSDTPSYTRVENIIKAQLKHYEEHHFGWWAVEEIDVGELIGWNGLQYLPETNEVEVAYLLSRRKWGQGLASEGAQSSLQFGFKVLKLETIIGITHLENIASQKVLEKIGMHSRERNRYFEMDCYKYIVHNPKNSPTPSGGKAQEILEDIHDIFTSTFSGTPLNQC